MIAYKDNRTPRSGKILIGLTVGYLLSPIDLIPDFILLFKNPIKEGFTFENVGFQFRTMGKQAFEFYTSCWRKTGIGGRKRSRQNHFSKLLARLYEPIEGRILLDGHDLREYDLAELRTQVGVIFQDYIRYQMTVSQNIAVGNIDEKENENLIINSAKQSWLIF